MYMMLLQFTHKCAADKGGEANGVGLCPEWHSDKDDLSCTPTATLRARKHSC